MAGNYNQIADYLKKVLQAKVDAMRENLTSANAIGTDNLRAGIVQNVAIYPDRIEGVISMPTDEEGNEYWQFVDEGVSGLEGGNSSSPFKFKNLGVSEGFEEKLANWMKAKYGEGVGWQPRKTEGRESFYGLGVHVKKKGIRRTGFYSDVINGTFDEVIQSDLVKKFGEEVFSKIGRKK